MTSFRLPSFPIVAVAFAVMMFGSSCLNDDNLIGPNCFDGILNNGEELVDCGGPICQPCDPCENGVWDQVLGEQWVDCGAPPLLCRCHTSHHHQTEAVELGLCLETYVVLVLVPVRQR